MDWRLTVQSFLCYISQGSHMGPILFLVYVQDLVSSITEIGHSLHADDLKLFHTIILKILQRCLNHVVSWGQLNTLKLNPSKWQVITFRRTRNELIHTYEIDGSGLKRVSDVKDLGVLLDQTQ